MLNQIQSRHQYNKDDGGQALGEKLKYCMYRWTGEACT